jgi:hypothetical protein
MFDTPAKIVRRTKMTKKKAGDQWRGEMRGNQAVMLGMYSKGGGWLGSTSE